MDPEARCGAEARKCLARASPGADPAAAAPPLVHQRSTNGRRSRRQRQLLWAQPNIPCRTPGHPGDANRDGPPLPLSLLLAQVCSQGLPTGAFLVSPLDGAEQGRDSSGSSSLCFSVRCLQLDARRSPALSKEPDRIACLLENQKDSCCWLSSGSERSKRLQVVPWRTSSKALSKVEASIPPLSKLSGA